MDLLFIAILFVSSFKYVANIEKYLDLSLFDESNYLYWGVTIPESGLPKPELGPLYAIWYLILSIFKHDRIPLYYLNFKLMMILPAIFLYVTLRKIKLSHITCYLICWIFLISTINATWPKVSHFALIILLLSASILINSKNFTDILSITSICTLITSFIRPEYFPFCLLSSLLLILSIIKNFKTLDKKSKRLIITFIILFPSFLLIFGLPLSGERSLIAFGQHFAINWTKWNNVNINPYTHWDIIMAQCFGSANSWLEAFFKNPYMLVKHISQNAINLITNIWDFIKPYNQEAKKLTIYALIVLSAIFVANISSKVKKALNNIVTRKTKLLAISIFAMPEIISVLVIYPREHYMVILLPLIITLIALIFSDKAENHDVNDFSNKQKRHKTKNSDTNLAGKIYSPSNKTTIYVMSLLVSVVFSILTPSFGDITAMYQPKLNTINYIKSLKIKKPVNLLSAEGEYNIYLGKNFSHIAEYQKDTTFNEFLSSKKINMIIISGTLMRDARFSNDREWNYFLDKYAEFGFLARRVPGTNFILLIHRELL